MRRLLSWLSRKRFPYEPLIHIGISRSRLLHNLHQFQTLAPNGVVAPVLKSNAYGHGLLEIARALESEPNIPFFVVDSYFEAVALRAKNVKKPLLVIGYTRPETIAESRLKHVAFTITTIETLRALKDTKKAIPFHIKIDTGFHRQGIDPHEIPEAVEIVQTNPRIRLEGICTHLPDADNSDQKFTEQQLQRWSTIAAEFEKHFPGINYIHGCNTEGSRLSSTTHDTVVRVGIGLYGLCETPQITAKLDLQPVLNMGTIITSLRTVRAGDTIGYSRTFVAKKDMKVATIPVGYFEGLDRRLSSGPENTPCVYFQVGARNIACPVVGRISMNITSIDVSAVPDVAVGTPVIVISNTSSDPNSIHSFAKACGTIDYESVVRIPTHLKREVVE